jgi:hypothetical protein
MHHALKILETFRIFPYSPPKIHLLKYVGQDGLMFGCVIEWLGSTLQRLELKCLGGLTHAQFSMARLPYGRSRSDYTPAREYVEENGK